jgi:hypothetical protein
MSAETQSAIAQAWQDARDERERLLAAAKVQADHQREQARRAVEQARRQRIEILEALMGVHRDLESVPDALESAYRELNEADEVGAEASQQKASTN